MLLLNKKLYTLLAEVLAIAPTDITDETSPENTPSWDSFNGLMVAAELEKAGGVQFTMADVVSVKKVGDIKKILDKYQVRYEC
ncbi:MAG: acyl carrier protein [Patescibacteria group bacterium]